MEVAHCLSRSVSGQTNLLLLVPDGLLDPGQVAGVEAAVEERHHLLVGAAQVEQVHGVRLARLAQRLVLALRTNTTLR